MPNDFLPCFLCCIVSSTSLPSLFVTHSWDQDRGITRHPPLILNPSLVPLFTVELVYRVCHTHPTLQTCLAVGTLEVLPQPQWDRIYLTVTQVRSCQTVRASLPTNFVETLIRHPQGYKTQVDSVCTPTSVLGTRIFIWTWNSNVAGIIVDNVHDVTHTY